MTHQDIIRHLCQKYPPEIIHEITTENIIAAIVQRIQDTGYVEEAGKRREFVPTAKGEKLKVMTPAEAVRNGADYIVIGRPIRDAADPARAARQVAAEIAEGLS